MEIIDGYTHCGISKYEPIEHVREVMAVAGVRRAVLVQHLGEFDNAYLARIAAADPEQFAAVCLVDHEAADCGEALRRWAETGVLDHKLPVPAAAVPAIAGLNAKRLWFPDAP